METLYKAYLKLDLSLNVLNYSDNLKQLFSINNLPSTNELHEGVTDIPSNLSSFLHNLQPHDTNSIMIIKNNPHYQNNGGALLFLYAYIQRSEEFYIIHIVNWLNWLHELHGSISQSYDLVDNLNNYVKCEQFTKVSKAACFKVFYPLIAHIPQRFIYGISQSNLFYVMRLFAKQKNNLSKDYARNLYLSLRSSLRRDYELDNCEIFDVIHDEIRLPINYAGNLQIPKTTINDSIAFAVNPDKFLINLIALHNLSVQ